MVTGLTVGALPATASAQHSATAATSLVFEGVTVVDVEQGKLLPNQRVVITGSRIQAIGSAPAVTLPNGAQVVGAQGKYLIPGLWDMHVHPVHHAPDYYYPLFLANGITGIRDAWSSVPLDTLLRWRREILAGTRVGPPRQILSGAAIDEQSQCERTELTGHVCVEADDLADAQLIVKQLQAAGADMLKTYNLSQRTYFLIAAEARRRGMRFGGHLAGGQGPSAFQASDSGAGIIDHMNQSGGLDTLCLGSQASLERCRPLAERLRRNGTWVVPTIIPMRNYLAFGVTPRGDSIYKSLSTYDPDLWASWVGGTVLPAGSTSGVMTIMRDAGIPILAGTDMDSWYKRAVFGHVTLTTIELPLYMTEGLTPLEALQTATLNPAKFLRATDSLGTVAAGKLADLVLLDANPLADVSNVTKIRAVIANGRYFDRAALDALLAEVQKKTDP